MTNSNENGNPEIKLPEEPEVTPCGNENPQVNEGGEEASSEMNTTKEQLAKKEAELKEWCDRYQRLAAEFDNFRKRTQKEKEKLYCDSLQDVVTKFLPVADNLERALSASEAQGNTDVQSLKDGVAMVFRQLNDIMDKLDVKPIEALGQTFDPSLHNAVMHVEDDSRSHGEIVEEFQKGYTYKGETVIRHSMVKVAN